MATQGRMLLSHNFNISDSVIPPLSRDKFAQVLATSNALQISTGYWLWDTTIATKSANSVFKVEFKEN